jgi:hypothetical protein
MLLLSGSLAAAAIGGIAHAQVHYSCNEPLGNMQICRDSDGNSYTVMRDAVGATISDSQGRTAHVQTDPIGGTTIQQEDGSVVRGRTDAFGNTTYEDEQGRQTQCHRSPIALPGQTEEDCQ